MPDTEVNTGKFTVQRLPSLAAAVAAPVATGGKHPTPAACANCAEPLIGPYCAHCGQHVADYHHSVWRFVVDFFDNTFCWDNKLFRTLGPLFRQPGFLTSEFVRGRRVRYVHPLRLFLFTSAVCLALLQSTQSNMVHFKATPKEADKAKRGFHVNFDEPTPVAPTLPNPVATVPPAAEEDNDQAADAAAEAVRSAAATKAAGKHKVDKESSNDLGDKIERAMTARIKDMGEERFSRSVTENFQQRLSWVALALLPVFALGLRAVYWRKKNFYYEHLIFSLHYHTFLLLFWTAYIAVLAVSERLPLHSFITVPVRLGLLLPPVYLFVALRRIYGDGPKQTAVKVLALGFVHLLAICIGVAAVGAAAFFSVK